MMNKIGTREFTSIQALRAIAAMGVVLFHLLPFETRYLGGSSVIPRLFVFGEYGVDLFFVISGFIITRSSYGSPHGLPGALNFLILRLMRVYPIYWFYVAVLMAIYIIYPGVFSGARGHPDIIASILLYPTDGSLLLLVSWTLTFEVQFYLLFALTLIGASRVWLTLMMVSWAVAIAVQTVLLKHPLGHLDLFFDRLNLEFVAGWVIARYIDRISGIIGKGVGILCLLTGVGLLVVGSIAYPISGGGIEDGWPRVVIAGGGSSLLLTAAVIWEINLRAFLPPLLVNIGSWSYSMYLSHLLMIAAVGLLWRWFCPGESAPVHVYALSSAFLCSLAFSWVSFKFIENPLMKAARTALRKDLHGTTDEHRKIEPIRTAAARV